MAPRYLNQRFGDYQLVSLLGQGGFAEVYGARQIHLGTQAAIKILNDSFTEQQLTKLREEARIVSQLGDHPQIVRLLTFSIERGVPYLVMPYATGGSLDKLHPRGKALPLPTIVAYVRQIAAALQYAHDLRIVHRDIKPANFLVTQDGRVQVGDFGIALMAQGSRLLTQQEVVGTWIYMAPEQIQKHAVFASDQYSLAVVVYQWLCGEPPFIDPSNNLYSLLHQHIYTPPPSLRARNPDIPAAVEQVVLKALAKQPEERYPSVHEFFKALEEAATSPQGLPTSGQRLGDYQLVRLLGAGSFAEVYEAQHIHLSTKAAIKILKGELTSEQVQTLRQEALTVMELDHPNIVRVLNFSVERGRPYLVMAYASGGSLETVHPQGQPLPLKTIINYVRSIAGALQYAHERRIIHRDIKPDNILLTQDGRVQIADFGISVMAHTTQAHNLQQIMGTWHYMAPEQFEGKVTPQSDQYALAIMVYRWLCGELPFTGQGSLHTLPYQHLTTPPPPLRDKVPNLSPDIEQVLLKALAKQPPERFTNILAFAHALETAYNKPLIGTTLPSKRPDERATSIQTFASTAERPQQKQSPGTTLLTYQHKGGAARAVAWSPDGTSIASGGDDATVRIWDAATGKTLLTLQGHIAPMRVVAWSPDGRLLASAGDDKTVHVWDANTGRSQLRYDGHTHWVNALAWSPDGSSLASGSDDKTVHVWEVATGVLIHRYQAHSLAVRAVAWSPNGRSIASASDDKTVQVWEATSGLFIHRHEGHTHAVNAVAWSPNGRLLASASSDKTVQVWDATSGRLLEHYQGHSSAVRAIAWSPNGRSLASASEDKSVQVWDATAGQLLHRYQGHTAGVRAVAWSPNGRSLASAGKDKMIHVWDATTGRSLQRYDEHTIWVRAVVWSPDGRLLASVSEKSVQVWENVTKRVLHSYDGHTSPVHAVAWSPDGRLLASAGDDKMIHVWEATSGRLLQRCNGHTLSIRALAWSPDSRSLASVSDDKTVQIWDATNGSTLRLYDGHTLSVRAVTWSPDGRLLASAGEDKAVHVWEATTGRLLHRYQAHILSVRTLAWSPDGRTLASAGSDKIVHVWDATSGRLLRRYTGHTLPIRALAWSPDSRSLASASHDGTVQVWEAALKGKLLLTYRDHYGVVGSVAWSPRGEQLASASYEVRIWQAI